MTYCITIDIVAICIILYSLCFTDWYLSYFYLLYDNEHIIRRLLILYFNLYFVFLGIVVVFVFGHFYLGWSDHEENLTKSEITIIGINNIDPLISLSVLMVFLSNLHCREKHICYFVFKHLTLLLTVMLHTKNVQFCCSMFHLLTRRKPASHQGAIRIFWLHLRGAVCLNSSLFFTRYKMRFLWFC